MKKKHIFTVFILIAVSLLALGSCASAPKASGDSSSSEKSGTAAEGKESPAGKPEKPEEEKTKDLFSGSWMGNLEVGQNSLRIGFTISKEPDGSYKALFDSPDQNAYGIPVDGVKVGGNKISLDIHILKATYDGKLDPETGHIRGVWSQGGAALPLELKRGNAAKPITRPQDPKPPYPYKEEEVTFKNTSDEDTLSGTLTYPQTGGSFPAVVLISGSGPQNRNEEIYNHRPFLVWADYLTRHGIAVLRYDDRGFGKSTGNFTTTDTEGFARDAEAAVRFLQDRENIDAKRIGLIGHSEGGIIAPIVADAEKVDFIVLLAGTGIPGYQVLLDQTEALMKTAGVPEDQMKKTRELNEKLYGMIRNIKDEKELRSKLEETLLGIGVDKAKAEATVNEMIGPWFRNFLTYDPASALEKVTCPVLAVNGTKDLQVDASVNLKAIQDALEKGGNKDVTVKAFDGLNHLFQPARTGMPSEYGKIETTVSPEVLSYVTDWILRHVK